MWNEVGGSKTDTIVKLVLVFFVSLLSFSVGTFVGKQVSDSDYRRTTLEQDYKGSREVASEETSDKSLSEDDIKSLTDEFVQAEKEKPAEGEKRTTASTDKPEADTKAEQQGYKKLAHKETEEKPEHPTSAPAPHEEPAKRVAAGQSPTADEPEPRKPNSTMPLNVASSAIGKYTVQVGSYPDEDEAKGQASKLKEKGWNAFYVPAEIKGRTWYRVSVGLFTNAKSAMGFREKFMKEANSATAIVQKIVQ